MQKLFAILFLSFFFTSYSFCQETLQRVEPKRQNSTSQLDKPYVIYISMDGFRYDYAEKFGAKHILDLAKSGVRATSLQPAFPTFTFPNHYSLATGMYPTNHGIINNSFYDSKLQKYYTKTDTASVWYGGTPIWTLAEQNKMLSACYYWLGSEAVIQGLRPSYWYTYNTKTTLSRRILAVKNWLNLPAEIRPHIITFYMPEVDMAAHKYGAESDEVKKAVHLVDYYIGQMVKLTNQIKLPINYVLVSDHGLIDVDRQNYLDLPRNFDKQKFIIPNGNAVLQLYAKNPGDILPAYQLLKKEAKNYDVYLSSETPKEWHLEPNEAYKSRLGDILLVAHAPKIFNINDQTVTKAKHGFDNKLAQMQGVFYAWGPAIKENVVINAFENIHVFPLLADILGLPLPQNIDGKQEILKGILK
jgi:predicted AlkP superfamily pyrophosphatase or phosphodiesterase